MPTLCQLKRDGRAYLTIVETIFTDPDESPLDNHLLREQYPAHEAKTAYDRPSDPWEDVLGELFRVDEPPRWILLMAGRLIYLLIGRNGDRASTCSLILTKFTAVARAPPSARRSRPPQPRRPGPR